MAASASLSQRFERTGRPVHLIGYSQGGMFVYETAAFRRSEGIASCVTFGAPVDFHGTPRAPRMIAPELGEHTDEILSTMLGLSSREITDLRDTGIVGGPRP